MNVRYTISQSKMYQHLATYRGSTRGGLVYECLLQAHDYLLHDLLFYQACLA